MSKQKRLMHEFIGIFMCSEKDTKKHIKKIATEEQQIELSETK